MSSQASASAAATTSLPEPPHGADAWKVRVYAHTHWDREWYHPFERFRMQLVSAVDRILATLAADPRFTAYVLDGQTIVLDDYLALRPERRDELAALIRARRIDVGPWYILPDEFLVSGESLVRNLLVGRRGALRFTDEPAQVGYLPDPFGHVAQIPQLLAGFGIETCMFSRGMGDEFAELGTEFRWVAPDGESSVVALVQVSTYTNGYCNAEHLAMAHDVDDARAYATAGELAPLLAASARTPMLLMAAGVDHETINPALPDIVERLRTQFDGRAEVEISGIAAYADEVLAATRANAEAGRPLASWSGELRGSLHAPILAAIFSARVPLKQDNALLQTWLERYVEPLTALAAATGAWHTDRAFLDHAWKLALQNQPHDSIGGCSVDAVHDEMPVRTKRAFEVLQGILEELQVALGVDGEPCVFNPHGMSVGGLGRRGDGAYAWIEAAPALQLVPLESVTVGVGEEGRARVLDARTIESDAVRVRVDRNERVQVTVRQASGEHVTIEDALRFVDMADAGDEYDFGALLGDVPIEAKLTGVEARLMEGGVAELELHHHVDLPARLADGRASRSTEVAHTDLVTVLRVAGDQPWVECTTTWENWSEDHRLRVVVSLGAPAHRSVADGHFAVVERPARPAEPRARWRQEPPPTQCMEAFAAVEAADGAGRGVAVLGRGLHEYEVIDAPASGGQAIALTILRSVGWLSRDDVAGRPGHAGPELATPGGQCLGFMEVEYAIAPYAGTWEQADVATLARRFAAPPLVVERVDPELASHTGHRARVRDMRADQARRGLEGARHVDLFNGHGVGLAGVGAQLSAIKLAEDDSGDLVVRAFNPTRATVTATLRVGLAHVGVRDARLDEQPLQQLVPSASGSYEVELPAGRIATWRITPTG